MASRCARHGRGRGEGSALPNPATGAPPATRGAAPPLAAAAARPPPAVPGTTTRRRAAGGDPRGHGRGEAAGTLPPRASAGRGGGTPGGRAGAGGKPANGSGSARPPRPGEWHLPPPAGRGRGGGGAGGGGAASLPPSRRWQRPLAALREPARSAVGAASPPGAELVLAAPALPFVPLSSPVKARSSSTPRSPYSCQSPGCCCSPRAPNLVYSLNFWVSPRVHQLMPLVSVSAV